MAALRKVIHYPEIHNTEMDSDMPDENDYVSVGTAAAILGVSRETIRRMIKSNRLPAQMTFHGDDRVTYRILRSDLDNVTLNPPHRPSKSSNKTET